jgi:glutamate racemase
VTGRDADAMIGVFDSGFGGLTVHRALLDALPDRDFVYLGDNRSAPYGARPPLEVLTLTCAAIERLFAQGCTLVVIACNTASTVALRWIQQQWLPARQGDGDIARNVIGIVVPTIEAATGLGWDQDGAAVMQTEESSTIAVFATRRTVETDCYPTEIRKRRPDIRVVQQACPELAGSIERGVPREDMQKLVKTYVQELLRRLDRAPECVILGCTHYPLVADLFASSLPPGVRLIHQPDATARALKAYVERHPQFDGSRGGSRRFLSTGYSAEALPLIERFWGDKLPFIETVP